MARKPSLTTESIKREIQADDAARKAKAAAKRATKKAADEAAKAALIAKTEQTPEQVAQRKQAEAAAALKTMREDWLAGFETAPFTEGAAEKQLPFDQFLADNGFNPDGTVKAVDDVPRETKESKAQYQGPMLALRDAAKHYVTGKNGNPHCADSVATILDGLTREQVVATLGTFLFDAKVTTALNPYAALNPGQQSMNLRNKLRGALKAGLVTEAALRNLVAAMNKA